MQTTQRYVEFSVFVFLTIFLYISGNIFWSSLGLSLFAMFSLRFFNNLGKTVDIRDLIIVLSSLQWVVGPFLSYRFYISEYGTYGMAVPENVYMGFVVPATSLFAFGMFIPLKLKTFDTTQTLNKITQTVSKYKNIDLFFIILGLIFNVIWKYMPGPVLFPAFLVGNMHFFGLLLLLQNKNRRNRFVYIILGLIFTFGSAITSGMFHGLILWLAFMFLFIAYIKNFSFFKKLSIIISLVILVIILQTVKTQFRESTWYDNNFSSGEKTEIFYDLVSENVGGAFFSSQENINNLVSRINQGWIISRIMFHVPSFEPYAGGETIYAGLTSTLLPRFIYDSKATSGGVKNFERFTGHKLQPGTSMNLSILGEAYANFGKNAIWFMFIFGLFLNYFYATIKQMIIRRPTLLFFIPVIYLQVIKAETDFVTVLNHLVKASIFVALIYWGLKKFLNIKL